MIIGNLFSPGTNETHSGITKIINHSIAARDLFNQFDISLDKATILIKK